MIFFLCKIKVVWDKNIFFSLLFLFYCNIKLEIWIFFCNVFVDSKDQFYFKGKPKWIEIHIMKEMEKERRITDLFSIG